MAGGEAIFAPTPPLESLRMVLSHAVTSFAGEPAKVFDARSPERSQVIAIDISRAYFNAVTPEDEPTYVELPLEFGAKPGTCALLRRHMYGTRRAADGWQSEYSSALRDMGFSQGSASACVFRHESKQIVLSVHGYDFTASGPASLLDWFEKTMRSRYELTCGGRIGPGAGDAQELRILNRIIRLTTEGVEYEADPRQVEKLLEEIELEGANGAATPE